MLPPSPASRSRNSLSTAMSASDTGEAASPLVQLFSGVPNIDRANRPASRTLAASRAASRCRSTSVAGNNQALHAHGRCIGAIAEGEVASRREALEYLGEMAGDGDFAHRISQRAALDPEAGG